MSKLQNDTTECQCNGPGWCERHKCNKTQHFYNLCKNNKKYFELWEDGKGPGQKSMPNLVVRGKNLAKATTEHIRSGRLHCSEEERNKRFQICISNKCGYYQGDEEKGVCSHTCCGCYIQNNRKFLSKLSWADSKCPVGLWGPEKSEN